MPASESIPEILLSMCAQLPAAGVLLSFELFLVICKRFLMSPSLLKFAIFFFFLNTKLLKL